MYFRTIYPGRTNAVDRGYFLYRLSRVKKAKNLLNAVPATISIIQNARHA
jgi:hypothetical protein